MRPNNVREQHSTWPVATKRFEPYSRFRYHLTEILATIVNEYTDWDRPVQHPVNIRDETLEALSDAQVVAPVINTADLHSANRRNSYLFVFDYQTKYGDYQQVSDVHYQTTSTERHAASSTSGLSCTFAYSVFLHKPPNTPLRRNSPSWVKQKSTVRFKKKKKKTHSPYDRQPRIKCPSVMSLKYSVDRPRGRLLAFTLKERSYTIL